MKPTKSKKPSKPSSAPGKPPRIDTSVELEERDLSSKSAKEERRFLRSAAPSPIVAQKSPDAAAKARLGSTARRSGLGLGISSSTSVKGKTLTKLSKIVEMEQDSDSSEESDQEIELKLDQKGSDDAEDEEMASSEESDEVSESGESKESSDEELLEEDDEESEGSEEEARQSESQSNSGSNAESNSESASRSSSESSSESSEEEVLPKANKGPLPGGFRALTLSMPPITIIKDGKMTKAPVSHQIFYKRHEIKSHDLPTDRTLFLVNIPVDTTTHHLQSLFEECGEIERIQWGRDFHNQKIKPVVPKQKTVIPIQPMGAQRTAEAYDAALESFMNQNSAALGILQPWTLLPSFHKTASTAYIVFEKPSGVTKAEQMSTKPRQWNTEKDVLGVKRWDMEAKLARPNVKVVGPLLDALLVSMSTKEQDLRLSALSKVGQPDEDGFVTVTRAKGRRGNVVHNPDGSSMGAISWDDMNALAEGKKKKKPKKELVNFYRFQMKEQKMNELADLRRKFEEDKKKIAEMKAQRKFKPY